MCEKHTESAFTTAHCVSILQLESSDRALRQRVERLEAAAEHGGDAAQGDDAARGGSARELWDKVVSLEGRHEEYTRTAEYREARQNEAEDTRRAAAHAEGQRGALHEAAVRPSRIFSLCTRSTRAGIEWCCCHRTVCMARPR